MDTFATIAASQRALESGHVGLAITLARNLVETNTDSVEALTYASWLFSGHSDPAEAVSILLRLEVLEPLDAAQNAMVGGFLLGTGEIARGTSRYARAVELAPGETAYLLAYSNALDRADRPQESIAACVRALRLGDRSASAFYQLSVTSRHLGRDRLTLLAARRAVAAAPAVIGYRHHLAAMLMTQGDYALVSGLFAHERGASATEQGTSAFLASAAHTQSGAFKEALADIDLALTSDPENSDFLRHKLGILGALRRFDEAAEAARVLLLRYPDDEPLLQSAFAIYTEAGLHEDATRVGARLVSQRPADTPYVAALQQVLGRLLRYGPKGMGERRLRKPEASSLHRRIPPQPNGLAIQIRNIAALFIRETKTRFGRARFGYAWVLFEPLSHIGVMIFLISTLNHGGLPPIGDSFALFYFTGIIPYHMFTHTAGQMMSAVPENRPLLHIPRVKVMDVYIARGLLELVTEFIVAAIFLIAFAIIGYKAWPIDMLGVIGAMLLLWLAAFGVGMINSTLVVFFRGWERIWGTLISVLYFSSGTFYIPRMMPEWIRNILVWNPVLQTIELVRVNYFHEPHPEWLDVGYLVRWAVGAMLIGFAVERIFRRKMLEAE